MYILEKCLLQYNKTYRKYEIKLIDLSKAASPAN